MFNLIFILLCFMPFKPLVCDEQVSNPVAASDTLLIEGPNVSSSDINLLLTDRHNISKIHVHVANTFFADEDLQLNGFTELRIFASTWNTTRPTTFDLSGRGGSNQNSIAVKGVAGSSGNAGSNGGNFFAWANEIINGERLTVILNGGNGGHGLDAEASDDITVRFDEDSDSGDSEWFSTADLHNYYKRYFSDRGYDPEIVDGIKDHTSYYAVFAQGKKASFDIRLHPRKCCGSTGKGGAGKL